MFFLEKRRKINDVPVEYNSPEMNENEQKVSNEDSNENNDLVELDCDHETFGNTFLTWKKYYNSPLFSDIKVLICNESNQQEVSESIYAHKFILSASSPKLYKMIEQSTNKKELRIPYKNPEERDYLKIMIRSLYVSQFDLMESELVPLLNLSNEYGIQTLKDALGDAIGKNIGPDNALYYYEIARQFGSNGLRSHVGKFLAENFTLMIEQNIIMNLDLPTWTEMLKSSEIKVKNEKELLNSVIKFAKASKDPKERINIYEALLPHIRWATLPAVYLIEMENSKEFEGVPCVHKLFYEAYRQRVNPSHFKIKHRKYSGFTFTTEFRLGLGTGLTISEDGLVLTKSIAYAHAMAVTNVEFYSGTHYWEIFIDQFTSGINIGVIEPRKLTTINNFVGSDGASWDYCNNGSKIHGGASATYSEAFTVKSTVGILLDCDKGTLNFFHNGRDLGKAYDLPKGTSFSPAVSLYSNAKVTLNPSPPFPTGF